MQNNIVITQENFFRLEWAVFATFCKARASYVCTQVLGRIMNSAIGLFLLLLFASPVYAAPSAMADDANNCPKARNTTTATSNSQETDAVSTVPAAATRATPVRNRAPAQRTVSPRWHSMLPGMFR
jgi:hypothetical protein